MADRSAIFASEEDILIAHISDLHFGSHNQDHCWGPLAQFIHKIQPSLVLVTGDIVETPKRTLYEAAKNALDGLNRPYYVCAGNHDRHPRGNRGNPFRNWLQNVSDTAALFDQIFSSKIAVPEKVETVPLNSHWTIGVLGVDSSLRADYSARGGAFLIF